MAPDRKRVTTRPKVEKYERWDAEREKRGDKPMTRFVEDCVDSALKDFGAVDELLSKGARDEAAYVRERNAELREELARVEAERDAALRFQEASAWKAVQAAVKDGATFSEIVEHLERTAGERAGILIDAMLDASMLREDDGMYRLGQPLPPTDENRTTTAPAPYDIGMDSDRE